LHPRSLADSAPPPADIQTHLHVDLAASHLKELEPHCALVSWQEGEEHVGNRDKQNEREREIMRETKGGREDERE
jgi:hypothetical protein